MAYGIVIGTGISFSTIVPVTTVAARWFRRYRGRAMAIPLSASGFAGFVGAPLINRILAANGGNWRQAWLVVAGIVIASGIVAISFVKERPEDLGQPVDGIPDDASPVSDPSATTAGPAWTPGEAYRTRSYWMVLVVARLPVPLFLFRGALVAASRSALFPQGRRPGRWVS